MMIKRAHPKSFSLSDFLYSDYRDHYSLKSQPKYYLESSGDWEMQIYRCKNFTIRGFAKRFLRVDLDHIVEYIPNISLLCIEWMFGVEI